MVKENKAKLIRLISREHVLEGTSIFKNQIDDEPHDLLDERTVKIIKSRYKIWHKTWVEKLLVELIKDK